MKQIVRRVIDRKGKVRIIDLPAPDIGPDQVLVQNAYSLISSGTELSTLAKTPVELVRQTLADPWMRHVVKHTIFATGIAQTGGRIWKEMIVPREIGYSGAGRVLAVGEEVEGFRAGDTVAYAATGHAEVVAPTINHIVPVPPEVSLKHAAFVTVGGIAMQSLRRAAVEFGEVVAVYGLGLVGQLCAMIAKAAGCVVIGIDLDDQRNRAARELGADRVINPGTADLEREVMNFTDKHGADATILCASSKSDEIVNNAMKITRRQGRVVIVGYVGLNVHPKDFLYRELDLRYSRAYGPGSYHNAYEKGRVDYPFGYVRWTERRNLGEFIRLLRSGRLEVERLIAGVYPVEKAQNAFDALHSGTLPGIAALIAYDAEKEPDLRRTLEVRPRKKRPGKIGIAVVGCGNHVLGKHLPHLKSMPEVELRGLVSATGKNAVTVAKRYGATVITTEIDEALNDPETDAVMICSSQPMHYEHTRKAIAAKKAVLVEKPMVTLAEDYHRLAALMAEDPVLFTLGLNRRYSSLVRKLLDTVRGPIDSVTYFIAQPYVPPDHWTLDEVDGAGRLITEGEHFIDLCHLLIGRRPVAVYARALGKVPDDLRKLCNYTVTIHYEGAVANVIFNESGARGFPRERVTVLAQGQTAVLDNFSKLTVHGRKVRTFGGGLKADMGHKQELKEFVAAIRGEPNRMLTWQEASLATLCMFAAQDSIRSGEPVDLRELGRALAGS